MIIVYILGGLVAVIVAIVLVGLALPRDHLAARAATFAQPPEQVWRALTDLDAQPAWRRGVKRIEQLSATQFREHGPHGAITYEVTEARPHELRITRIADTLAFGGRWIYELAAAGTGTRLTITEDGFITNPIFRVMARTVFSTSATLERFLGDLGTHLGTPAPAEPAEPSQLARR